MSWAVPASSPCASPPKGRENSAARCSKTVCSRPSSAMCARNLFSIAAPFLAARHERLAVGRRDGGTKHVAEQNRLYLLLFPVYISIC